MLNTSSLSYLGYRRCAAALALATACASASALPQFIIDPSAVGLNGSAFTGDNLLVANYSTVTYTFAGSPPVPTGFTDLGYLAVVGVQLGNNVVSSAGLNTSTGYGLYFGFLGAGTASGSFTSLNYTLYGYNVATPTTLVTLASGSLGPLGGSAGLSSFGFAQGGAQLTFVPDPAASAAFVSPSSNFYGLAFTAFSATPSQVTYLTPLGTGFTIANGSGQVNFLATAVPEPETYALMICGLAAVGFAAKRNAAVTA